MEGPLAEDLRAAGVEVFAGPLAVLRREVLTAAGLRRLVRVAAQQATDLDRLVRAQRVDVVHANTSVILGVRRAAPRLVTHVREIYPRTPVLWPLHRRQILAADRVLCVSAATRAALEAPGRVHVRVVHDGLGVVREPADRDRARLALGLPREGFVVAVLGRISGWKGQEVMVRALAPGMIGVVAGDTWPGQEHWEQRLRAAISAAGADVRLVGFRDDVETVYGAADVVVVPSTSPDPLPNSALEAAAAGCCVVAADHGGLPEIVRDGRTGRLVAPGDPVALARVLAELAANPARAEHLGDAAREDVRRRFAPELLARRVMDVWDELV